MNMRYLAIYLLVVLGIFESRGQSVSITTDGSAPHASSMLEIKSTTKGLLMPRMSQSERNAIGSPATSLMIYQTDSSPGFYFYNGSSWSPVSIPGAGSWLMAGNSGSNPATDFIGTTDYQPLRFRINNTWVGELHPASGNACFGISAGFGNTSGTHNAAFGLDALLRKVPF